VNTTIIIEKYIENLLAFRYSKSGTLFQDMDFGGGQNEYKLKVKGSLNIYKIFLAAM
jgi:hypothetical protein